MHNEVKQTHSHCLISDRYLTMHCVSLILPLMYCQISDIRSTEFMAY